MYIEDITRWREDMVKTIFCQPAQRLSKILFLTRENKIHMFKQPSFYYVDKSIRRYFSPTVCANIREKARNDVINMLTREDAKKLPHSGPGCFFCMNFTSRVFSSKTLVSI